MPKITRINNPTLKWWVSAFIVFWVLLVSLAHQTGEGWRSTNVYMLFLPLQLYTLFAPSLYLLAGGVLASVSGGGRVERAPLAAAEFTQAGGRTILRWPEGRSRRRLQIRASADFVESLQRAAFSARSAAPGEVPITRLEMTQALSIGFPTVQPTGRKVNLMIIVACLAIWGLAAWLNQPLFLLPFAAMPWLIERNNMTLSIFALVPEGLWVINSSKEPRLISLEAVRSIQTRLNSTTILTSDSEYGDLRLNRYTSNELITQLKRRLQGSSAVPFSASAGTLSCTLCGRPEPHLPVGRPEETGVHICEYCSGKARLEALQSGHGLSGKEAKPM